MDRAGRMRQDRRAASRDASPIVAATALSGLADRRTPDASAFDDAPLANAHVRVLVVDADDDNVEATGRVLCALGYDIGVSRNPRDALATALLLRPVLGRKPSRRGLIQATRGLPPQDRILAIARILGRLPDPLRAAAYGAAPAPDDAAIERAALRRTRRG